MQIAGMAGEALPARRRPDALGSQAATATSATTYADSGSAIVDAFGHI